MLATAVLTTRPTSCAHLLRLAKELSAAQFSCACMRSFDRFATSVCLPPQTVRVENRQAFRRAFVYSYFLTFSLSVYTRTTISGNVRTIFGGIRITVAPKRSLNCRTWWYEAPPIANEVSILRAWYHFGRQYRIFLHSDVNTKRV